MSHVQHRVRELEAVCRQLAEIGAALMAKIDDLKASLAALDAAVKDRVDNGISPADADALKAAIDAVAARLAPAAPVAATPTPTP